MSNPEKGITEEELKAESEEAKQRHADYYFKLFMERKLDKAQLQAETKNFSLALNRLRAGEVKSEYTEEELSSRFEEVLNTPLGRRY